MSLSVSLYSYVDKGTGISEKGMIMKYRFHALAVALLAGALVLPGCAGNSGGSSSTGDASNSDTTQGASSEIKSVDYLHADYEDLKQGGTLTLPIDELSSQGNPFHMDGTAYTSTIWSWYNPNVIMYDDDFHPYANPDYVTDVKNETVDGKTVITYTINEQAKWNDGTDIDWTAFRDTWIISRGGDDNYAPSATDGYQDIESVEQGENAKQAVVTFNKTFPWYWSLFGYLANPHLVDPEVYSTGYLKTTHPEWGAGPYTVQTADYNQGYVTFVPNDKWWGKAAKLDSVTYRQMESSASLNAFQNGEIDATSAGNATRYAKVKDLANTTIYTATSNSIALTMLNAESEILSDIKVREAIFTGTDRQQLSTIRFNGMDYTETPPGSFIYYPSQKDYYQDNFSKVVTFDVEKAKSILDEAGWKEGSDGIREKDGQRLEIKYVLVGDSELSNSLALARQTMMKNIGIDMQIEKRSSTDFSQVYTNKEFDIFDLGFRSGDPFGAAWFGQIYQSDSGLNLSGTGTAEMDAKIAEVQALPTIEEQNAAANELEVEAFKLYGIMPLYCGPSIVATKTGLANYGALSFASMAPEMIGWVETE